MKQRQRSTFRRALGTCALLLSASCARHVPAELGPAASVPDVESLVDSVVSATMTRARIPGAAIVIVHDGRIALSKGYGVADVETSRPVVVNETVFRIGSVTKVLTALAIARLVDQDRIQLDDAVSDYVPRKFADGKGGEPIRVRHLLTHTAGFDQVGLRRQVDDPSQRPSLAEFLEQEARPLRPPGQVGVYDTYGITLAGHLAERVSGFGYAEFMRRHVFEPLGMHQTWVEIPAEKRAALATGYGLEDDRLVAQDYEWYVTLPASSVDATVADMGRLLTALLDDGGPLFGRETAERIRTERQLVYGNDIGAFSWGFWEARRNGYRILHHGGIMAGYSSELYLVPSERLGFFIAYTRDPETGPAAPLREAMVDLVHERILPRRPERTTPAEPLAVSPDRFAGAYGTTVACFTCEEGEGWPMSTMRVTAEGPGTLGMYGGAAQLVAIDSTKFLSKRTGNEVAFLTDEAGRVRYLVQGPNSFAKLDEVLLDEVLGSDWRDQPVHPLVARVHFARQDWNAATRAYDALTQQTPTNGRYHFNLGFTRLHTGEFQKAEASFRRALELRRWAAWSQYYIAAARAGAGDLAGAWSALDRAIEMGFSDANLLRTEPWWGPHRAAPEYRAALSRLEPKSSAG